MSSEAQKLAEAWAYAYKRFQQLDAEWHEAGRHRQRHYDALTTLNTKLGHTLGDVNRRAYLLEGSEEVVTVKRVTNLDALPTIELMQLEPRE